MRLLTLILLFLCAGPLRAQEGLPKLVITPLTGDFYVYQTFAEYRGARISANALYLVTGAGVVLFDTPWDSTQFQPLLDSIRKRHGQPVVLSLATHFHEDRTGGLEYYRRQGIQTYTTRRTDSLSRARGMKRAEFLIDKDTVFRVGRYSFQTFYPGPGHAPDNIVAWFEKERILYGGCLVKSVDDATLGNLGDADTQAYAQAVRNVQARFRDPKYIIPGHNGWADTRSLEHTLRLAEQLAAKPTQ